MTKDKKELRYTRNFEVSVKPLKKKYGEVVVKEIEGFFEELQSNPDFLPRDPLKRVRGKKICKTRVGFGNIGKSQIWHQ